MGLFNKKTEKKSGKEKKTESQDVIRFMVAAAEKYMEDGMYDKAFQTYRHVAELTPNAVAQYNLGSLYAQGKGTRQDYLEGAYWFHQANLAGDEQAGRLRTKCMMDYIHQNLDQKTPRDIFDEMLHYAAYLYPRENGVELASSNIYALAGHHFNRKEYAVAAKLFRAAAEFGDHGEAQNYLAVLYNAGAGVEKDDLAALYWFDRAADHHVKAAQKDRDGIFQGYKTKFPPKKFYDTMEMLSNRCTFGDQDIPRDGEKAKYWRNMIDEVR